MLNALIDWLYDLASIADDPEDWEPEENYYTRRGNICPECRMKVSEDDRVRGGMKCERCAYADLP